MGIWKAAMGRVREEKKKEERRSKYRKSQKKEDPGARKGRKVAKHCVFQMICGSGGSKSRLAKAPSAEPSGQMRDKSCTPLWRKAHVSKSKCTKHTRVGPLLEVEMWKKYTPLWREAHFEVKMYKTPQCRTTFGSCDVEKVHAVVAWSTCPSQNVQNTPCSDHFSRLTCRKKCTPLWREARFQVEMLKTPHARTTVEGSDVVSRGRRKGLCNLAKSEQNVRVL